MSSHQQSVMLVALLLISCAIRMTLTTSFKEYEQKYSINENEKDVTLGNVATDGTVDLPLRNTYRYYLSDNPADYFSLDAESGQLKVVNPIDCEKLCTTFDECPNGEAKLPLTVNVKSGSEFVAIINVKVIVKDMDDNDPQFQETTFTKTLEEFFIPVTHNFRLPEAIDRDINPRNREIVYTLEQNDGPAFDKTFVLKLIANKPYLEVAEKLDYEQNSQYSMTLKASHRKKPNIVARLPIIIKISDINDNKPEFSQKVYTISIREDLAKDSAIIKLNATDKDHIDQLTYTLIDGDSSLFRVEPHGTLLLIGQFDYEKQKVHKLRVQVSDRRFSVSTEVIVNVRDINDEPPEFKLNTKHLTIEENLDAESFVGQVQVTDRDSSTVNGEVLCKEPQGLENKQPLGFEPNPATNPRKKKFRLYTRQMFDREQIPIQANSTVTSLLICHDQGMLSESKRLTSTLTLTLTILDVNDNDPKFTQPVYYVNKPENEENNNFVINVKATDPDIGDNGRLTYHLEDTENFQINRNTGRVIARRTFDRENKNEYVVKVLVNDNGSPMRSASAKISITVMDVNDHNPQVVGPTNFQIMENQGAGHLIGTIRARDEDEGDNGRVVFTLMPTQYSHLVILNRNGTIFSNASFDRENIESFKLDVRISDMHVPVPLSIITDIRVEILDQNDNNPVFQEATNYDPESHLKRGNSSNPIYSVSMRESPGYLILRVRATDPDFGPNGMIIYSIVRQSVGGLMHLDERTGELKLNKSPTRSDLRAHHIIVKATDQGSPKSLSSQKTFTIQLEDTPPRGERAFTSYRTPGYRNIWIVIILSAVSAFLATVLITAILCMVRPCSSNERRQRNNRTRQIIESGGLGHHPLYDLHDNGILYSSTKKGQYESGLCPNYPGSEGLLEHMMVPGVDTYMTGNQYFMSSPGESGYGDMQHGSQDGLGVLQDSNWNLGQNRHITGSLCVDSNQQGSQEFLPNDRMSTLQKSRLKKGDQIRMWPYDPNCGKCPTLPYGPLNEQPATMGYPRSHPGAPINNQNGSAAAANHHAVAFGGEEQQSDSGRGGSDEELPHGLMSGHLFHHGGPNGGVVSSGATSNLANRGPLMVTFNSPPTCHISASTTANSVTNQSVASITTSSEPHGSNLLPSYTHLRNLPSLPPISTLTKPPKLIGQTNGSTLPPYTPPCTATTTTTAAALNKPPVDQPGGVYSPASIRNRSQSITNQNGGSNSGNRTNLPPVSSVIPESQPQNPVVVSLASQSKTSKKSDPERLCDEIDQLFFKDML